MMCFESVAPSNPAPPKSDPKSLHICTQALSVVFHVCATSVKALSRSACIRASRSLSIELRSRTALILDQSKSACLERKQKAKGAKVSKRARASTNEQAKSSRRNCERSMLFRMRGLKENGKQDLE
jgi:hypothetical protein